MAEHLEKRVVFTNPAGEKLVGSLHRPNAAASAGLVMGHCFTCSRHTRILSEIGSAMAQAGFMALRFDFSGNGQSEGDFADSSYSKYMDEMCAAMDFLADAGCAWIALAGHSMGAAVALLTAVRTGSVKALCTLAGRYSQLNVMGLLDRLQQEQLADTGRITFTSRGRDLALKRHFFEDARRHDPARALQSAAFPILAIHGDQDEIIPWTEAVYAQEQRPDRVKQAIIPGADHMFSMAHHRRAITAVVVAWFLEQRKVIT